eukprot:359833-Chlamydomonas_euryale.AAC.13
MQPAQAGHRASRFAPEADGSSRVASAARASGAATAQSPPHRRWPMAVCLKAAAPLRPTPHRAPRRRDVVRAPPARRPHAARQDTVCARARARGRRRRRAGRRRPVPFPRARAV